MGDPATRSADLSGSRFTQAYSDLRNLILAGHFTQNARLTEAELTSLLDVSRATVRLVTLRLTQEGYLTSEPNRGVRTRLFSIEEAAEILEAREVAEAALAGKAAVEATEAELDALAETVEEMATAEGAQAEAAYSSLNRRFHQQIRQAARQRILAGFVESLVYPLVMRQYRNYTSAHPRTNSLNEHRAILFAIQTRNPEAAAAAMRHHVASARRALLLNLTAESAEPQRRRSAGGAADA
jgi:DNA-binding GntR family transcriptional regulator